MPPGSLLLYGSLTDGRHAIQGGIVERCKNERWRLTKRRLRATGEMAEGVCLRVGAVTSTDAPLHMPFEETTVRSVWPAVRGGLGECTDGVLLSHPMHFRHGLLARALELLQ
jgi:hypothetical protein